MYIVIASPHACIFSVSMGLFSDPNCDKNSKKFAKRIYQHGVNIHQKDSVVLVISKNLRKSCDNNRIACRNSAMRKRLRNFLQNKENEKKEKFVFEIHSFSHGKSFDLDTNPDVVLLETGNSEGIIKGLYQELKRNGVFVVLLKGSNQNDIQMELNENGIPGILVEIRTDITNPVLNKIIKSFYSFIDRRGSIDRRN